MKNYSSSLATEFLLAYNELEFAVKAAGLIRGDLAGTWANWSAFGKKIVGRLTEDSPEFDRTKRYFQETPPRKQIVRDGKLLWCDHRPNTEWEGQLVLYLRRIQNGLYQGPELLGERYSPESFDELLQHGLVLIDEFRRHCGQTGGCEREAASVS